jgi:bacterioferritin
MKSDPQIIALLNDILTAELTAINQYFLHARLCHHWGFARLYEKIRAESIEEMKHADVLIERILYLEGHPNVQRLGAIRVGETPAEKLTLARDLEQQAIARLNQGIARCVDRGDGGSRALLEGILTGEDEHADWLETQLELIRQLGDVQYLTQQISD